MNTEALQQQLCNAFCRDIQLVGLDDKRLRIETPFTFPDGDHYQLYLQEMPTGGFTVSDAGHTWMHISYENDLKNFKTGNRGQILQQIVGELGLEMDNGAFYKQTTADKLPETIMQMGQALTKIYDLTFLNRARVESTFYEDLKNSLYSFVPNEKIQEEYFDPQIEEAQYYPIDYRIEGKEMPLYLFGVPNKDKARLATIIIERLLHYTEKFDSMIVFQESSNIPQKDFKRLMNVGGEMISSLDAEDDLKRKVLRKVG